MLILGIIALATALYLLSTTRTFSDLILHSRIITTGFIGSISLPAGLSG